MSKIFFADDQVLIADREEEIDKYEEAGIKTNVAKAEYLRIGEEDECPELQLRQIKVQRIYELRHYHIKQRHI